MSERGFIQNIVAVGVVLGMALLSQQAFFRGQTKTFYYNAQKEAGKYVSEAGNWLKDSALGSMAGNVAQNIAGGVKGGGEAIKNKAGDEINKQKENILQSAGEKVKNYFSGITDAVLGKNNQNSKSGSDCSPVK